MIVNAVTGIDTILDEELLCDYIYDEDNYYVRSDLGIDDKDLRLERAAITLVI
jgi:hypothetical protein